MPRIVAQATIGITFERVIRDDPRGDSVTRLSGDEVRDGTVWNGFDYALQVWVVEGVVQRCGHPPAMARRGPCCPAFRLAGRRIDGIPGAQRRPIAGAEAESSQTGPAGPPTKA
jgi:hypothetical protein